MRSYILDLPGGTATNSIQIAAAGTLKEALISYHDAAAGKIEISRAPTSQIGTAQPTKDVIARINQSGTAGDQVVSFAIPAIPEAKLKILDLLYVHQTGAGNLGTLTIWV
jgi:hypothetical protein